MSNLTTGIALIAVIVFGSLIVAAYPVVMGSVHNDAVSSGATMNASINGTLEQGQSVAQGFMGFQQAQVLAVFVILIIVVLLFIFKQ